MTRNAIRSSATDDDGVTHSAHNLPDDVQQLQDLLLTEREQRKERAQQLAAAGADQAMVIASHLETIARQAALIDTQEGTIQQHLRKIAGLQKQLEKLLRRSYGPQWERIAPNQLMLFAEDDIRAVAKDLASGAEDSVPPDDGVQDEPTNNDAKGEDSSKPSSKCWSARSWTACCTRPLF